jgi:hypothetical protein
MKNPATGRKLLPQARDEHTLVDKQYLQSSSLTLIVNQVEAGK